MKTLIAIFILTGVVLAENKINSVGSDTLNNMMALWAESYHKKNGTNIFIEGKGSSTAIPAMIEGKSDIGPLSRKLKPNEIEKFKDKYQEEPFIIDVAIDSLAVFVHKDNPIVRRGMSLQEIDAIFSITRHGGHPDDIDNWSQFGLKGDYSNKKIVCYGRNSASATYGFFQKIALFKGSFKSNVKEQPSGSPVSANSNDKFGISYSNFGYKTTGVKMVPIIIKNRKIEPNKENAVNGSYPLARSLKILISPKASKQTIRFLKFVLSAEGQKIVDKDGYIKLPQKMAQRQIKKLENFKSNLIK